MNPQEIFCPNIDCHARDGRGKGRLAVHRQHEKSLNVTSSKKDFLKVRHDLLSIADGCPDGDVGDHVDGLGLTLKPMQA